MSMDVNPNKRQRWAGTARILGCLPQSGLWLSVSTRGHGRERLVVATFDHMPRVRPTRWGIERCKAPRQADALGNSDVPSYRLLA
jgi:hypothetical protein